MTELHAFLLFLQSKVMPPSDPGSIVQMLLRWVHFLAGITWIGLLYFFNLVNVGFMKKLDGPTKGKVVPALLPSALWWFRWGALVTVLAGIAYWMIILGTEPFDAPGSKTMATVGLWTVVVLVIFAIEMALIRTVNKNGYVLGVLIAILAVGLYYIVVYHLITYAGASNRAISIGVGGGLGVIMLLNVWAIIWPAQKRIIAWTAENAEKGTAIPAESGKLARQAFLASRTNTWLSLPMLWFMAAASHFPMFTGG